MKDSTDERPADETKARAPETTAHYLRTAIAEIDAAFGEGYAREHPELVASFVQASAIEAAVEAGREASARTLDTVTRLSRDTNETILRLKPKLF